MTDHRTHARRPDGRTYCGRARAHRVAGPHEIEDVECESCLRALPGLRSYVAIAWGMDGYYAAESAGQARIMAARTLVDAGYCRTVGDALRVLRVRRLPFRDLDAMCLGRAGALTHRPAEAGEEDKQ